MGLVVAAWWCWELNSLPLNHQPNALTVCQYFPPASTCHGSTISSIAASQLQRLSPLTLSLGYCAEFLFTYSSRPCGLPQNFPSASHLPGTWWQVTWLILLPLDVNECVNVCFIVPCDGLASHPGCIPSSYSVFLGTAPENEWIKIQIFCQTKSQTHYLPLLIFPLNFPGFGFLCIRSSEYRSSFCLFKKKRMFNINIINVYLIK